MPSDANAAIESLLSDQKCFVRWQLCCVMPEYYSDVVAFGGVVINPLIEFLGIPEEFEFYASAEEDCVHDPASQTWSYRRAFIGGQHVRVWWKPKTTATQPRTQ
jgi:hypothetical protein